MKTLVRFALSGVLLSLCSLALAQPIPGQGTSTSNRMLAETLFREARSLMAEKRYDEACPKFAESNRLDPASGTLLGLAMCHEAQGKIASAWAEFQEVLALSRRGGRMDRAQFASERIGAIEPRLTRVTILASDGVEGLVLELDGVELGQAALGVATPMDPGLHRLTASAPGSKPWVHRFAISEDGGNERIEVPPLEPLPPSAPATPANATAEPTSSAGPGADTSLSVPVKVAGAATLALTAAAIGTGVVTLTKASSFDDANDDPGRSYEERQSLRDSTNHWALANTVLTGGALVGAAITGYLYFTREQPPTQAKAPPLRVWLAADGAGVGWAGTL